MPSLMQRGKRTRVHDKQTEPPKKKAKSSANSPTGIGESIDSSQTRQHEGGFLQKSRDEVTWNEKFANFKNSCAFRILDNGRVPENPIWNTFTTWTIDRISRAHHLLSSNEPTDPENLCHKMYELVFPCLGMFPIGIGGSVIDVTQFMDAKFELRKKLVSQVFLSLFSWNSSQAEDAISTDTCQENHRDARGKEKLYGYSRGDRLLALIAGRFGIDLENAVTISRMRVAVINIISQSHSIGTLADWYSFILEITLKLVIVTQEDGILAKICDIVATLVHYIVSVSETHRFEVRYPMIERSFLNQFRNMVCLSDRSTLGESYVSNILGFVFLRNQFYLAQKKTTVLKLVQSIPFSDIGMYRTIDLAGMNDFSVVSGDGDLPTEEESQSRKQIVLQSLGDWLGKFLSGSIFGDFCVENVTFEALEYLIKTYSYCNPGKIPRCKVTVSDLVADVQQYKISQLLSCGTDFQECRGEYSRFNNIEIKLLLLFVDRYLKPCKKSKILLLSRNQESAQKLDLGPIFNPGVSGAQFVLKMYNYLCSNLEESPDVLLETISNSVNLFKLTNYKIGSSE